MPTINRKVAIALLALIVMGMLYLPAAVWAKNYALLIGINEYKHPTLIRSLEGPEYDVKAMQQVLEQQGFDNMTILLNAKATKANIINAIHNIQQASLLGDNVIIYFSGHGTSRKNKGSDLPLPYNSGALVPYEIVYSTTDSAEAVMDRLIVGKTDLQPVLKDLDNKGVNVLALFDACYSGKTIRSVINRDVGSSRYVHLNFRSPNGSSLLDNDLGEFKGGIDDYPYSNIFYISASSDDEQAREITSKEIINNNIPTFNGEPHGVLTDAILKAISGQKKADLNNNGSITMEELYQSVTRTVKDTFDFIQTPQCLPVTGPNADKLRNMVFFFNADHQSSQVYQNSNDINVQVDDQLNNIKRYVQDAKDLTLSNNNPDLRILLDNGRIVMTLADYRQICIIEEQTPELITQRIRQYAEVLPLIRLSYPSQRHNVAIRLENKLFRTIFKPEEVIGFSIESEKRAYLLLLVINPEGRVNVIYPYSPEELAPQPAKRALTLSDLFKIELPCGTDTVKVFAFTEKPQELEAVMGKENIAPGSEDYLTLCRMVFDSASTRMNVAQDTITVTSYDKEDFSNSQ